jgi:hypothetical protein
MALRVATIIELGATATLCPGLFCHFPFGAWGRSDLVGGAPQNHQPPETGHASRNRPAPKGQNRSVQGRATRRSRSAPP